MKTMNVKRSSVPSQAPQRRNRGISSRTPVNVSRMPSPTAVRTLRDSGTLAWARRAPAPVGSVIFQRPATRKTMEIRTAAVRLNATCHPRGASKGTRTSFETAIPSAIYQLVYIGKTTGGKDRRRSLLLSKPDLFLSEPNQEQAVRGHVLPVRKVLARNFATMPR